MLFKSFYIWGNNDFSRLLGQIIEENHHQVIAFIDNHASATNSKPVYTVNEFKEKATPEIPIIVAPSRPLSGKMPIVDFETLYQFKRALQEISEEHKLQNLLLHPASLTELMPLKVHNKSILFGLPGSGITIMNHLLQEIFQQTPQLFSKADYVTTFFEHLCFEYTHCLHQMLADVSHLTEAHNFHFSAWKIGTTSAITIKDQMRTEIYSFPTRNHLINKIYNYHHLPSKDCLIKLAQQGFKLFHVQRNPLDILLSYLNKSGAINHDTKEIDPDIFFKYSHWVINQLHIFHSRLKFLLTLNYDELIKDPIGTLISYLNYFNIAISPKEIKKIWDKNAYQQISSAPRLHYWSGGSGKWQVYFKPNHLAYLKYIGMEEILEKFGYGESLHTFRNLTPHATETGEKPANSFPNTCFTDENQDCFDLLQKMYGPDSCSNQDLFCVASSHKSHTQQINHLLHTPFLNKILRSGILPEFRII